LRRRLVGNFLRGTVSNKVFGIFRINTIVVGGADAKININVKFNKAGANKFN
jgi:hypothetical protein